MAPTIERVQTGVRIEKRILGVLKALADLHDLTLGDLLEGMALHAFEGKVPFTAATLRKIQSLKEAFDLDLTAEQSHRLVESSSGDASTPTAAARRGSPPRSARSAKR